MHSGSGANSRSTPRRRRPPHSVSCLAALLREEVKRDCTPTGCLAGRLKGLLKCKPPELRVGNLSSIQGHRDTHIIWKNNHQKVIRLSGLQSEMNQRVNVHYLNIEKREYPT